MKLMSLPTQSASACPPEEKIEQLQAQITTLEELLQLYQESATEQEHRLQTMLHQLQERAQQLEHSQTTLQTLQTILDSMGDAVVVIDQKGCVLFLNAAAQQLLKKEPIERSFRHWTTNHDIFGPDGTTPYPVKEQPLTKAIQGYSIDTAEMRIVERSTCQSKWFSVNAKPIKSDEQVIGAVAVFRDVGHQKKTEEILKKSKVAAQQQAQRLKEALTQLKGTQASLIQSEKMSSLGTTVAGIAHEINNPVNFIHGNLAHTQQIFQDLLTIIKQFQANYPQTNSSLAEILEEMDIDFLERDIPNMLASMKAGTQRIREVIQSLRLFSHLDEADLKAVDIHKGIDSVLMILQSQLKKQPNREAINVICHYGELPLIECHARQLNQVFVNLMRNAIDALSGQVSTSQTGFSKAGSSPTITIQTEIIAENAIITINDNGIGIPEEIRDQIFDPFFTTKPVGKGTGLGLSSCYQIIVETHKGTLKCLSQVGEGTQFVIELPLSQQLSS